MPARKIPRNYRHVTGIFKSILKNNRGVAYESPLERDYYLQLEFVDEVESYEGQPVKIEHLKGKKPVSYYPDCLIVFKPETGRRKLLIDIKNSEDIEVNKENFVYRHGVVASYAEEQGWGYDVVTEIEIRADLPYLYNLKFLYKNARAPKNITDVSAMIQNCNGIAGYPMTVNELLAKLTSDTRKQLETIPAIWHLVCVKRISTDLHKPLNMNSILEVPHVGI